VVARVPLPIGGSAARCARWTVAPIQSSTEQQRRRRAQSGKGTDNPATTLAWRPGRSSRAFPRGASPNTSPKAKPPPGQARPTERYQGLQGPRGDRGRRFVWVHLGPQLLEHTGASTSKRWWRRSRGLSPTARRASSPARGPSTCAPAMPRRCRPSRPASRRRRASGRSSPGPRRPTPARARPPAPLSFDLAGWGPSPRRPDPLLTELNHCGGPVRLSRHDGAAGRGRPR